MYRIIGGIIGILLIGAGIAFGAYSHQVVYQRYQPDGKQEIDLYYQADQSEFSLHVNTTATFYLLSVRDFQPEITAQTFDESLGLSYLVYTAGVEEVSRQEEGTGREITGVGHQIVKLVLLNGEGQEEVYATATYNQNPEGYYQNNWIGGGIMMLAGAGCFAAIVLWSRRRSGVAARDKDAVPADVREQ